MKLSVQLTQSPVVVQPCRSDVRHMATLTGTVSVSTRRAKVVHGLEVVWEVYHQTRKDVKEKWEKERSLETYTASVLEGFVADGDWSERDARRVATLIAADNARRLYRL